MITLENFKYEKVKIDDIFPIVKEHAGFLSSPWDSYMEENLFKNETLAIYVDDRLVGHASVNKDMLFSFYVRPSHFSIAPSIFADFVKEFRMETAQAMTNDPLFAALLMEWEYEITEKNACFFTDGGKTSKPSVKAEHPVFRIACASDIPAIGKHTGDFFDVLEERIAESTIFVLEDGAELMGCGVLEPGKIHRDCVSIGMITRKEYRHRGVAQTILWQLKEWAYTHGLRPIAGCWYYNVLSRKSLESVGMIATGKSYMVKLIEKKTLPLRTGNPPGELVPRPEDA